MDRRQRTAEKNVKVVQDKINECLVDDEGSLLKRVKLAKAEVQPDNKEVYLEFTDPVSGKPTFASRAQVSMLLSKELKQQGLEAAAQQMTLEGLGQEEEGRSQWMAVHFLEPVKDTEWPSGNWPMGR